MRKKRLVYKSFAVKQKALACNLCEAFFCSLQVLAPMGRAAKLFQGTKYLCFVPWNGAGLCGTLDSGLGISCFK